MQQQPDGAWGLADDWEIPLLEDPLNALAQPLTSFNLDDWLMDLESFPPSPPAAVVPSDTFQEDPLSLTPTFLSTSLAPKETPPHSPLDRGRGPFSSSVEIPDEGLLERGYPGDSPTALERRAILRRMIFNERSQLPVSPRDIKKLAYRQMCTGDDPDHALPIGRKQSRTPILQCAWAGCNHSSSRADRLKTHVFCHIGFKPFPCDGSCGDPHCTARFYSKGDCNSHQTRHKPKNVICENCGEETTTKNLTRHTRSTGCRRRAI